MFDESTRVGGFNLDLAVDTSPQLKELTDLLRQKVGDVRADEAKAAGEVLTLDLGDV
jgi:hypothetical protein